MGEKMEIDKKTLYRDVSAIVLVLIFIVGVGGYLLHNVLVDAEEAENVKTSWNIDVSWSMDELKNMLADQVKLPQSGDTAALGKKHELKNVKLFAAGPKQPAVNERKYNDKFPQKNVQYIYTEISYKNAFYHLKDGEVNLVIQYYKPDGSLLAENKRTAHPKKEWATPLFTDKWGYEQPGQWQPGIYKIKVLIEGDLAGEYSFEIYQTGAVKPAELL